MSIKVTKDPVFKKFESALKGAPKWLPPIVGRHFRQLGRFLQQHMRDQVDHNRYTGRLQRSIRWEYNTAAMELTVNPTAMRGAHDAGMLLELGTRPIPNAPWAPIKKWARKRGLPAFPVWYKIRTRGVAAQPFVEATRERGQADIDDAGQYIVDDMADRLFSIKGETT